MTSAENKSKNYTYVKAYLMLVVTGLFGGHRFYFGRHKTGAAMLSLFILTFVLPVVDSEMVALGGLTFLSLIIWYVVDFFLLPGIISNQTKGSLKTAYSKIKSTDQDPHHLPMLPEEFVVFDLETTGLSPHENEIIEIGAIKVLRDSSKHKAMQTIIKPQGKIPKEITKLTGITNKMAANGDTIESAIKEFVEFIGDLRLVAYNAPFDMGFLREATKPLGIKIKNPVSDPLKMMRLAFPGLDSYRLHDVAKKMQLPVARRHRALDDCKLTVQVYASAAKELNDHK